MNSSVRKKPVFWLFGNVKSRRALVFRNPSVVQIEKLKLAGYELIWDSAPSCQAGYEYGEEHAAGMLDYDPTPEFGFYEHSCCGCDNYMPVQLYTGSKFNNRWERYWPFKGHLCEQCAANELTFNVQLAKKRKSKS